MDEETELRNVNNLPQVKQLGSGKAKVGIQEHVFPSLLIVFLPGGSFLFHLPSISLPHDRGICFDIPVLPGDPWAGISGRCTPVPWREKNKDQSFTKLH